MILDDFERIQLIKQNWQAQIRSPSIQKRFVLIEPEQPVDFKLPFVRIKQSVVDQYKERFPRKLSRLRPPTPVEKPALLTTRVENMLMIEQMTRQFEKLKQQLSQRVPTEEEQNTFITKPAQTVNQSQIIKPHERRRVQIECSEESRLRRVELTNRSPLGNAYYGLKALPKRSQIVVCKKANMSFDFRSRLD